MLGSVSLKPPTALVAMRAEPSGTSLDVIGRVFFMTKVLSLEAPRLRSGARWIEDRRTPISQLYLRYIRWLRRGGPMCLRSRSRGDRTGSANAAIVAGDGGAGRVSRNAGS